ncbi:YkyA family protein [Metabacillus sp. KIGAM252]|uniref:YkyA family protein n=2 Tax=Metabacillus flavus TaxID=2823519 RepID=A0ABS5LDM0_9BACI|nr:YkyA family protein [Metabacillus flavus]MBS2968801.1 YkyA family protein [Metabacillus flavus]
MIGISAALSGSILTGCMGPSPSEQAYEALENVVSKESPFKKEQKPLLELEQKENKIYNEIIALGMKDFNQIKSLSGDALKLVADRKERVEAEQKAIADSEKAFKDAEEALGKIEDEKAKKEAAELKKLMHDRYNSYNELAQSYKSAIALDEELYKMFQNKDLKLEELEAHISKINASYKEVMELNKKFNDYTEQYNTAKKEFYQAAELKVEQ